MIEDAEHNIEPPLGRLRTILDIDDVKPPSNVKEDKINKVNGKKPKTA